MHGLEERVERLEIEIRRWRALALILMIAGAISIGLAAQGGANVVDVVRAKRVEAEHISLLVDGQERAWLGVDDQGMDNRIIGLFLNRKGSLGGDYCARFAVFGQNQQPELVLSNRDGKFVALISAMERGGARISVHDPEGKLVKELTSEPGR